MYISMFWNNLDGEGCTDVFSEELLTKDISDHLYIHPVVEKGQNTGFAVCLLTVNGNDVEFDYRPFPVTNTAEGIYLGRIHIKMGKEDGPSIRDAYWCADGGSHFEPIDVMQSKRKRCPRTPMRIYELLADEGMNPDAGYEERIWAAFSDTPKAVKVQTTAFVRNPVVARNALIRARGVCERCGRDAPFISRSSGEPFLEVHHLDRLSDGGPDTLENVVAICPNCHRQAHFGL